VLPLKFSFTFSLHRITEWLRLEGTSGRDLVLPPCSSRPTYSRLPRTMSRWFFSIYKDGESTKFLGNLDECSVTLTVEKESPDVQAESSVFQFVPTASCPDTGHH